MNARFVFLYPPRNRRETKNRPGPGPPSSEVDLGRGQAQLPSPHRPTATVGHKAIMVGSMQPAESSSHQASDDDGYHIVSDDIIVCLHYSNEHGDSRGKRRQKLDTASIKVKQLFGLRL